MRSEALSTTALGTSIGREGIALQRNTIVSPSTSILEGELGNRFSVLATT